ETKEKRADVLTQLMPFEQFYEKAEERSQRMVDNLLSTSRSAIRNPQSAMPSLVLVAGGFHTPQIAQFLRDRKIPYVVVTPKITHADEKSGSAYLSVFAQEKTPLDRLFAGEKLFLSPTFTAVGSRDQGAEDSGRALLAVERVETVAHDGSHP